MAGTDPGWLELLMRDAPVEEFTHLGAVLRERGITAPEDVSTALELRSLLQQRAQRAGELTALNDIARELASQQLPDDLLEEIVNEARRLLRVDLAYLGLVESTPGPAMRIAVASGALTPDLIGLPVSLSASLAGEVIDQSAPRWVPDYLQAVEFRHDERADAAATSENIRGLLGVPLRVRGQVIGALFAAKRSERHFTEDEVLLLSSLASHAAIAIHNAHNLERLSSARDELSRRTAELERTVAWNQQLTQLVLRGGGVADLLEEIGTVVNASVRFVQTDASPESLTPEDRAVLGAAADGPLDGPFTTGGSDEPGGRLVLRRVLAGNRDFGILVVSGAPEPSSEDILVVDQAAAVLGLALVAEDAVAEAGRYARDSLLGELLTASPTEPAHRTQLARRAGLDPSASYMVVVIGGADDLPATRRLVQDLSWPAGTLLASCQGRLVALTPTRTIEPVQVLWTGPGTLPNAGAAGPVLAGADISTAYAEAVQTLHALTALSVQGEVRTSEGMGLFRILLTHAGREEIATRVAAALGPITAEQERSNVPLLDTLEQFLIHGQRPRPTARALAVHVNTLYQRLATLDRVLGSRWRELDPALELHLLLRLRRAARDLDAIS